MKTTKSISVTAAAYAVAWLVEEACADLPTEPAAANALADRVWRNMPQQSRTARGG